jgi:hypothetical protein
LASWGKKEWAHIMFEWYYTRNKQQCGPVNSTQLKELAAQGELLPSDLVWKDGMTEWVSASTLKSLFAEAGAPTPVPHGSPAPVARAAPMPVAAAHAAPAPVTSAVATAPAQTTVAALPGATTPAQSVSIPYYSPTTNMNTLAVSALRGFPAMTGPRGEFPLSEEQLKQVATTARFRAPIRRAAALYKVLFFIGLVLVSALVVTYLLITTRYSALGGQVQTQASSDYFMRIGIIVGLSALCLIASKATDRCQIWAPITMIVHFAGWLIYFGWEVYSLGDLGGSAGPAVVMMSFAMIAPTTFLLMSVFALTHVKRFLRRPLWTVHLLVQSKL